MAASTANGTPALRPSAGTFYAGNKKTVTVSGDVRPNVVDNETRYTDGVFDGKTSKSLVVKATDSVHR